MTTNAGNPRYAVHQPWNAPSSIPAAVPAAIDTIHAPGVSAPSQVTWTKAISIPVNAICDPTERSIWRATMRYTMPQAMIAVTHVWMERL